MTAHGRHAWIDASAGVAGDMLLAALVDAGADLAVVSYTVGSVIPRSVHLARGTVSRAGLRATKIDVRVLVDEPPHRTWRTVREMLAAADIPEPVRRQAMAVFTRLAEAEGQVHGVPAQEVHFHEVGALDSIADIVGVCAALYDLGIGTVSAGEVAVGSGRVRVAHGDMPVPVPAVAQLALGWRVRSGGPGERATPTGMALVTTLAATCAELPALSVDAVGVGAGARDTEGSPNIVRVVIGDPGGGRADGESVVVLETNVDDQDPRLWPALLGQLLTTGALDAWLTPILMKKGRPAHTLSVLCRPTEVAALRAVIFLHTSTIGIRQSDQRRFALPRAVVVIDVAGEPISVKVSHVDGVIVQVTPEFEDVAVVAVARGLPTSVVLQDAMAAAGDAGLRAGRPLPTTSGQTVGAD